MYSWCFGFRGELGFLNCDDVCMCVVNKVIAVSACMSGTHGSGVLSSTCDVLEMSVVRVVGGVCDMCMCLARGGVGWEGVSG